MATREPIVFTAVTITTTCMATKVTTSSGAVTEGTNFGVAPVKTI
jgi:hypothetical protein